MSRMAVRGAYITYLGNPFEVGTSAFDYQPDGLIVVDDGVITAAGAYADLKDEIGADTQVVSYDSDHVIVAGFLDTHVHYPQIEMVGAYGAHLLDWLNRYTFPTELQFSDSGHARAVAREFLRNCLRAGTTTAMVYGTVFKNSIDVFFQESEALGTRMIAGKVLMDRNAPDGLTDTPQLGYDESLELGERWHGRGRQLYCVTPRFAPTSTPEQLAAAGALRAEHPEYYMQTHLSETVAEIEWVQSLFPERDGYYDVYDHYGLTGPRAVFGHCVHLRPDERSRLYGSGSAVSHCPTSNLFLGSGLFDIGDGHCDGKPARIGLGTDLGAGTTFSQLATLGEAYKVALLNDNPVLDSLHAFYLATRGSANSIYLEDAVGSIRPGMEADLVVLDLRSTPYLSFRMDHCDGIEEALFVQQTCADDRAVHATYVAGELLYRRDRDEPMGQFLGPAAHLNHQT